MTCTTNKRSVIWRVLLAGALLVALAPLGAAEDTDKYSPEELEEIVAPIALYPDVVISSMLPAAAAPTAVVQAARWVKEQGGEISEPPADSGWDPAVEAMVQFPDVLTWMSENLDWLEMLGYAVSVQEGEVLQAIQDFRVKAKDAGNLETNDKVQVQDENNVIYIEPAQPSVVYVPTYDPVAVIRPGYTWPSFWAGFAAGAVGAWAWHNISWGHHGGYGSINVNRSPSFNFNNNGTINHGNIGGGNHWNAPNRPTQRPSTRPNTRPRPTNYQNRPANATRPGQGGVKPGGARPGQKPGGRPGTRPGGAQPSRPAPGAPGGGRPGTSRPGTQPGGGARPSKPATRPSQPTTRPSPSKGSRDMMSGSSNNGRSTRNASSRGNRSLSGGSSRGGSRPSGGSRGGGSRGGGGGRRR